MKLRLVVAIVLVAINCIAVSAQDLLPPIREIPFTQLPIIIDGNANDWSLIKQLTFALPVMGKVDDEADASCKLQLACDSDNLYGFIEVKDDQIGVMDWLKWQSRDHASVAWSTAGLHYQFAATDKIIVVLPTGLRIYNPVTKVLTQTGQLMVTAISGGWNAEFCIPFGTILPKPPGNQVFTGFCLFDKDSTEVFPTYLGSNSAAAYLEDLPQTWKLTKFARQAEAIKVDCATFKKSKDGLLVESKLDWIVTYVDESKGYFSCQEKGRGNWMEVRGSCPEGITKGDLVISVKGRFATDPIKKTRYFQADNVDHFLCGAFQAKAIHLNGRDLGPINSGLLVALTGRVKTVIPGGFIFNDGSRDIEVVGEVPTGTSDLFTIYGESHLGDEQIVNITNWLER